MELSSIEMEEVDVVTAEPARTMTAAWYDRQGPAAEVLRVGELPVPLPSDGEVRVAVSLSGVSPGDTKKRAGTRGSLMPYPRVIPHSDAAGIIDAVGNGVNQARVGERVWVYGAQSYRPFGTAGQWTVVPDAQATALPDQVSDETGAALGIPGITAHRAVFGDGPVTGKVVLVQGALGAVGSLAAQLATWGGATVIGTVRHTADLDHVERSAVARAVALDQPEPAAAIRGQAPAGVDRIVEVDFPFQAKQQAARDLTEAAAAGALSVRVGAVLPLTQIATAHERVAAGAGGRVLIRIPD